jgi:hypothetical protein
VILRSLPATRSALVLGLATIAAVASGAQPQRPQLVGRWRIEFSLSGEDHVVQFDGKGQGQGTLLLQDSISSLVGPSEPTTAGWTAARRDQIAITGDVAFPRGNVGREPGTLVFTGALDAVGAIKGRAAFYREGQDVKDPATVPAKSGTFTARKVGRGSSR